jgi:hypothetical protein
MIPVGYMAKRVYKRPDWLKASQVSDIYSVSNCISENFADYINYWKHNGYWFFDSPDIIQNIAKENSLQLEGTALFYYEAHEVEFDNERWQPYLPEPSFPTNVIPPSASTLRASMWLLFSSGLRQSAPRCPAIRWRKAFAPTVTAYLPLLMRPKPVSKMGHLPILSRDHIASLLCIRWTGPKCRNRLEIQTRVTAQQLRSLRKTRPLASGQTRLPVPRSPLDGLR